MKHETAPDNGTLPIMARRKTVELHLTPEVPGTVPLKVVVKEFTWHDTFELLRMLSENSANMVDDKGRFAIRVDKIVELLSGTQELTEFVITRATGMSQEDVRKISFTQGLELLDAALEINLSPEIIGRAKKAGGRITAAIGVKLGASRPQNNPPTPTPPQPSISSSARDTASTT